MFTVKGVLTLGSRPTAARWMAEAGCSERETISITRHAGSTMVSRYVHEAGWKRRTQSAATKVSCCRLEQASAKPHG